MWWVFLDVAGVVGFVVDIVRFLSKNWLGRAAAAGGVFTGYETVVITDAKVDNMSTSL